jgi:hypothetical protein
MYKHKIVCVKRERVCGGVGVVVWVGGKTPNHLFSVKTTVLYGPWLVFLVSWEWESRGQPSRDEKKGGYVCG